MANKVKVYHFIPWDTNKNLGSAYNDMMSLLKNDDDWGCFLDGDAIHTTQYFGKYIEKVIEKNPDYQLFGCKTNRVITKYQLPMNNNWKHNSQLYHRNIGKMLWKNFGTKVTDITNYAPFSGVLILLSKKMWTQVGGFKEDKMIGIDSDICNKVKNVKGKIGLMEGIYVQHWYRGGNVGDIRHLK